MALAVTLAGCGGKSEETAGSAKPATTAAAAGGDEQQIRDVVGAEADAFKAWDFPKIASLTCNQFRDQVTDPLNTIKDSMPQLSSIIPPDKLNSVSAADLSAVFAKVFPTAPEATREQIAQAAASGDDAAYQDALVKLIKETTTITVDKVDKVTVAGDTATADITVTRSTVVGPPQTTTSTTPFVREDGQWKDCANPADE